MIEWTVRNHGSYPVKTSPLVRCNLETRQGKEYNGDMIMRDVSTHMPLCAFTDRV